MKVMNHVSIQPVYKKVRRKTMGDDLLMWKNGQMLILREHEMIALQEEMLLLDGTRIALDGRVILADGTFQALVEGQSILVEGAETFS